MAVRKYFEKKKKGINRLSFVRTLVMVIFSEQTFSQDLVAKSETYTKDGLLQ